MSTPERGWGSGRGLPPASPVSSSRVGQRVRRLGTADQLGVVRFVGEVEGRTGTWFGVEWDEHGKGDCDGELNGRRYFVCSQRGQKAGNAASFVRESELFSSGARVGARVGAAASASHPHVQRTRHAPSTRRWWCALARTCTTGRSGLEARPRPRSALLSVVQLTSAAADSMTFDFLMLMRNFSCCGARCIVRAAPLCRSPPPPVARRCGSLLAQLPEDDDGEQSASSAALSKMMGTDTGRGRPAVALREMTPPTTYRRITADNES